MCVCVNRVEHVQGVKKTMNEQDIGDCWNNTSRFNAQEMNEMEEYYEKEMMNQIRELIDSKFAEWNVHQNQRETLFAFLQYLQSDPHLHYHLLAKWAWLTKKHESLKKKDSL
jgi:hypothetical protein